MKKYFFFVLLFCIQQSFSQNLTGIWHGSYQYGFRKAHYSYTITLFINLDNKGFLNIHSHKLVKKYNNMDSIVVNKVEILKRKKNKITLMVVDTTTQVISSLQKFNLKYKVKANAEYLDGSWSSQNYEWSTFHFSNYNNSGKIKLKKYTSQNADSLNISVKKIN